MGAVAFMVLLAVLLVGSTVHLVKVTKDCTEQGGVVVRVVEWGDGLACIGEDN